MVTRNSNIIPEMCVAFFECTIFFKTLTIEVDRGSITEPQACTPNFLIVYFIIAPSTVTSSKSSFKNRPMICQLARRSVLLYSCGALVDQVEPGERVTITGIYGIYLHQVFQFQACFYFIFYQFINNRFFFVFSLCISEKYCNNT